MQTVKNFVFGKDTSTHTGWNNIPLEDQINDYLEYHPGYSVATMSLLNASDYKEALVVFNVREERLEKHEQNDKRRNGQDFNSISVKDYKNQNKNVTTANGGEKNNG